MQLLVKTHSVEAIGWTSMLIPPLEEEGEGCDEVQAVTVFCSELHMFCKCFAGVFCQGN